MMPEGARTAMLVIAASAILAGNALAQESGNTSAKPAVEPPPTTGQAPPSTGQVLREAPTGHRQPAAKDAPAENGEAASHAANQEIDRRLNICRGC